jgi:hypothetical protein
MAISGVRVFSSASQPTGQAASTVPVPALWLSYLPFHNQQPLHANRMDSGLAVSMFVQGLDALVR